MKSTHNDITSISALGMVAQIRHKQFATVVSQNKLIERIKLKSEECKDKSGNRLYKLIADNLTDQINIATDNNISQASALDVGFPIQKNKTLQQLNMAKNWTEKEEDNLISRISKGILLNGLSNNLKEIPTLKAPSDREFWGNENASVSTVLLYSVAMTLNIEIKPQDLLGAATFYPYYNSQYKNLNIKESQYVFEDNGLPGWLLFGSYQLGGHKYFKEPDIFFPEDCSSAVGKATGKFSNKLAGISTTSIMAAYDDQKNIYGYKPVTTSRDKDVEINKIQNGDIFVKKGHTAIVSGINNSGEFDIYELNRSIDVLGPKMEGGGAYSYNIKDFKSDKQDFIFFLRKDSEGLEESANIHKTLERIDKDLAFMEDL